MPVKSSIYPETSALRDDWILSRRGIRKVVDATRPYATVLEQERSAAGEVIPVGTIFLTNKECPWRCLMCDLWQNTLHERVAMGLIPRQVRLGLGQFSSRPRHIKLYNSGSFFDPQAIPPDDFPELAELLSSFENVIVESHPALINERAVAFARDVPLEVAMGLETVHPEVLPLLNKRMTLDQFARAAEFLVKHGVAVRTFILVKPPFIDESEAVEWATRSVDFAFECGASVVSLIPVRLGNGALEELGYVPPRLATVEASLDATQRERVFVDLWDLERLSDCPKCFGRRRERLERMNSEQCVLPRVQCDACGI